MIADESFPDVTEMFQFPFVSETVVERTLVTSFKNMAASF